MRQERLFRLAVEHGSVNFHHHPGIGWSLTVWLKRGDEAWDSAQQDFYEGLTTVELLDTIAAHLDTAL